MIMAEEGHCVTVACRQRAWSRTMVRTSTGAIAAVVRAMIASRAITAIVRPVIAAIAGTVAAIVRPVAAIVRPVVAIISRTDVAVISRTDVAVIRAMVATVAGTITTIVRRTGSGALSLRRVIRLYRRSTCRTCRGPITLRRSDCRTRRGPVALRGSDCRTRRRLRLMCGRVTVATAAISSVLGRNGQCHHSQGGECGA